MQSFLMSSDPLESSRPLPSVKRYGGGAMAFHWGMFVLVVIVGVLGLLHDTWPQQTQSFWINVHAVIGLAMWALLIARLGWRYRHAPPPLPDSVGSFARRFSSPVHWLLYTLLFVTPILGFITFVYHGRVFDFGFVRLNLGIAKNRAIFHPTEDIHGYLAYALFALAGLHALAALWHQLYLRDGVLMRMWPRARE